jgi:tetratricopeptide (TPR) repeat protein
MTRQFGTFTQLIGALLLMMFSSFGQPPQDVKRMNAREFDAWTTVQVKGSGVSSLCEAVLDRLRGERRTNDAAILRCIDGAAAKENGLGPQANPANRYANTLKLIDDVLAATSGGGNTLLRAKLWRRKASLEVQAGDFAAASEDFAAALKLADPARLEADIERMGILVDLGQSLLSTKRLSDAEQYFLQALSYSFYTVVNYPDEMQKLRDLYIRAGRGLIETRRHNLSALQQIVFVPSTMNELGPLLEKAVQEAKYPNR